MSGLRMGLCFLGCAFMTLVGVGCGGQQADTATSSIRFTIPSHQEASVSYVGNAIIATLPAGTGGGMVITNLTARFFVPNAVSAEYTFTPRNSASLTGTFDMNGYASFNSIDFTYPATMKVVFNGKSAVFYTIYVVPGDLTIVGSAGTAIASNNTTYPMLFSNAIAWKNGTGGQLGLPNQDTSSYVAITGACETPENHLYITGYAARLGAKVSKGYCWPLMSTSTTDPNGLISIGIPLPSSDATSMQTGPISFTNNQKITIAAYTKLSNNLSQAYTYTGNATTKPALSRQLLDGNSYNNLQIGGTYTNSHNTTYAIGSCINTTNNTAIPYLIRWDIANISGDVTFISFRNKIPGNISMLNVTSACTNNVNGTFNNIYIAGSYTIGTDIGTKQFPFYCSTTDNLRWDFQDLSQNGIQHGAVQSIACDSNGKAYMVGSIAAISGNNTTTRPCCWSVPYDNPSQPTLTLLSTIISQSPNISGGSAMAVTANGPIPYIGGYLVVPELGSQNNKWHPCMWIGLDTTPTPVLDLFPLADNLTNYNNGYVGGMVTALCFSPAIR